MATTEVQKVKIIGTPYTINVPSCRGLLTATACATKECDDEKLALYSASLRAEVDQFIKACEEYIKAHADNPARG